MRGTCVAELPDDSAFGGTVGRDALYTAASPSALKHAGTSARALVNVSPRRDIPPFQSAYNMAKARLSALS